MSHNTATLNVTEAINESSDRPLHQSCGGESQESDSWTNNFTPTGIASIPALDTDWNTNSHVRTWKIDRSQTEIILEL